MKLISIIVTTFNNGESCIKSILAQKFSNFELIVVDNGSTDAISAYKKNDSRLIVIRVENDNIAEALNIGLDAATGRYVLFVNPEDCIEEHSLEKFSEHLWQDYDVIFTKESYIQEGQNTGEILQKLAKALPDNIWDKLIRRRFLTENDIRFTPGTWEEADFCISLYLQANNFGVLTDMPNNCQKPLTRKEESKKFCQKLIQSLSRWTSLAEVNQHEAVIQQWMVTTYCDKLIPLYSQLSREDRKGLKNAIDDFRWLFDISKSGKNQMKKIIYYVAGPWVLGRCILIKKETECL